MFYYLNKYAFSSYKTLSLIDACLKDEINIKDCQLRNIFVEKQIYANFLVLNVVKLRKKCCVAAGKLISCF